MDWPTGRQVVLLADAGLLTGGDEADGLMAETRQYAGLGRTERHE
jgi:hypothetical protein